MPLNDPSMILVAMAENEVFHSLWILILLSVLMMVQFLVDHERLRK
jgi:hypothetical protein